jgi:hypothetical protein
MSLEMTAGEWPTECDSGALDSNLGVITKKTKILERKPNYIKTGRYIK